MIEYVRDISAEKSAEAEGEYRSYQLLRSSLEQTINALASASELRDPYTAGHQKRVAELSYAIGREMRFSDDRIKGLRLAATIHDIGKLAIPSEILSKPTRLSDIEYRMVQTHPQIGYDILKSIIFPWPVARLVLQHHERFNGSGYPQGLKGKEIITEARIIGLADAVEVMCTYRPYKPAMGVAKAIKELRHQSGVLYDPAVASACIKVLKEGKFRFKE